ncbi:Transferase [Arabidopsis thaliana x Arabidopsis arenosa]|uniref:Transferase n=1 Tax=Arabidopsis thaliana x Arabidopsis arenosa TaxID=1240361 RepID=A0A8T1Y6P2_9BRAS|nr:Transferase [Arabidopsis thaliana x Arabidopsis arenosa]
MEVKLEVAVREVIKPDSPSPRDRLQLSILDLYCPAMYLSTIFFYDLDNMSPKIFSENLKSSLSETLSRFYPLAGRIEGVSISCNDEGAAFTEARTDLLLLDFLRNLNTDCLSGFLPTVAAGESPAAWPLLSVKVTFFGSGSGVAVCVSVSHKICDAASLVTFIKDWATTAAKGKSNSSIEFAETTIYPPPPSHMYLEFPSTDSTSNITGKCLLKRFVFEPSKIAKLRHKAASESVPVPTRVEAVTSLIWRCARKSSRSNLVIPRQAVMWLAMDLRLRIPSNVLPQEAIGNLQSGFSLKKDAESEFEIPEIVAAFRKTIEGVNEMIKESVQRNTTGQSLLSLMAETVSKSADIDRYIMTSWCRKPFYKADFGSGSPVWVGYASHTIEDNIVCVVLIDSKEGDGVEAWISLPEEDMSVFVDDQELLAYAVLNPPVLT